MNFKVLNVAEAFPKIMRGKLRTDGKGDALISLASKGSQLVAQRRKFGTMFSRSIAGKLTAILPRRLEETGIMVKMAQVHCGDMGFVVLRVEVVEVDLMRLLEKERGSEFARKLGPLVGIARRLADVDRHVVPKLQQQMMLKLEKEMPQMLKEKMALDMLVVAKPSSEQADFFFGALAPHKVEVEIEVLNATDAAPRLAQDRARLRCRRSSLLAAAAGALASTAVAKAPDKILNKVLCRRLSTLLPERMADVGVTLTVVEKFSATGRLGVVVLRCDVTDVDLAAFRAAASAAGLWAAELAGDQHFLRLGHRGRSDTYQAIRSYISVWFPQYLLSKLELEARAEARDPQRGDVPEMLEIDLSGTDSDRTEVTDAPSAASF